MLLMIKSKEDSENATVNALRCALCYTSMCCTCAVDDAMGSENSATNHRNTTDSYYMAELNQIRNAMQVMEG